MTEVKHIPLFPLKTVLFPGMILPLHIFEKRYKTMIAHCMTENSPFGVLLIKNGRDVDLNADYFDIGTTATITQIDPFDDGRMSILATGLERFRLLEVSHGKPYLVGRVEIFPLEALDEKHLSELGDQLRALFGQYLRAIAEAGRIDPEPVALPEDLQALAFQIAVILDIPLHEKQTLLGVASLCQLLETELTTLRREMGFLRDFMTRPPNWLNNSTLFSPN